jgi:hypothetical protein
LPDLAEIPIHDFQGKFTIPCVVDDYCGATGGKTLSNRPADATRASSNQRCFTLQ